MTQRPTTAAADQILGQYFPVLDHGFVALVDYMGTDECVERAARVSYGHGTRTRSTTRGLIRYLRRHRHTTPTEMVELKFHCGMPVFVARQWIRHRTASVNEYSGRYSLVPMRFYMPPADQLKPQRRDNRQGRAGEALERQRYQEATRRWEDLRKLSVQTYEWLAAEDVARELARIDLPQSTYTQWYWKTDLHNLFHFLTLRTDEHAQWEIQQFARTMAGIVQRVAPLSYEAWLDYEAQGVRLSRMELNALGALLEVETDDIKTRSGALLDRERLRGFGLSPREVGEFLGKLRPRKPLAFELDPASARPAEYFEALYAQALPSATGDDED